ncbi:MAG: hypothetical protein AAB797_03075, partial [Patescibacteria group bacterium]
MFTSLSVFISLLFTKIAGRDFIPNWSASWAELATACFVSELLAHCHHDSKFKFKLWAIFLSLHFYPPNLKIL